MRLYGPRTNIITRKRRLKTMTSTYFKLEEFLTSSTARQKSIENLPSWAVVDHLKELALFLDDLREKWGTGIKVSSGYRNEKLNSAVGGVSSSAHRVGYAADLLPANGKFNEFVEFVKKWLQNKTFDQALIETKGKTKWLHLSLRGVDGKQRCMIKNLTVK